MNAALVVQEYPPQEEDTFTQANTTLQLNVLSAQSKRAYASDTLVFRRWLDDQGIIDIQQINYDVMLQYRQYLYEHYAVATVGRRFVVARRLLEMAKRKNLIDYNPAADVEIKGSSNASSPHTALTKKQVRKLLAVVDTSTPLGKRDYAMIQLLIGDGLRRFELVAARIGDISEKQELPVLTIQHGKGNERRDNVLRPDVYEAIWDYLEAAGRLNDSPDSPLFTGFRKGNHATDRAITDGQVCDIIKSYAEKAGLRVTPHDLRATFATLAHDAGAKLVDIQHHLGHKSPATTERYISRKQHLIHSPALKIDLD